MCTSDCTSEDLVRISHGIKPGFLWQQQQKTIKTVYIEKTPCFQKSSICFTKNYLLVLAQFIAILFLLDADSPWRIFQEENPMIFSRAFIIWWYVFLSQDIHKSMSKFLLSMYTSKGDL